MLHDNQGIKPLAIAPILKTTDNTLELRVSCLDDELMDAIRTGIRKSDATIIHEAGNRQHTFTVMNDSIDRIDVSWNSLITRAQPVIGWTIETLTPTVCRGYIGNSKESVDIIVPQPNHYFSSWLYRFQSFAPVQMPNEEVLDFISSRLSVTFLEGKTVEVPAGKSGQMIAGFLGTVTIEVLKPKPSDRQVLQALDILAALAEFSGTGAHTIWGMGVTRIASRGKVV
jgi:CRISPR-associated endoribonuclease Cas6